MHHQVDCRGISIGYESDSLTEFEDFQVGHEWRDPLLGPQDLWYRRPAVPVGEVSQCVADPEQCAARSKCTDGVAHRGRELPGGEVEIEHNHKVEDAIRLKIHHVVNDPADFRPSTELFSFGYRDRRKVDRRDIPTLLREPDRIAPLAARNIQSRTGSHRFDQWG